MCNQKNEIIEATFKIFTLLSPFIAAFLIYFLGLKSKKKDIDIEKEKELNTILSNLLNVWHYLTRLESIGKINSDKEIESILPREFLHGVILNTGFLNDKCFKELDESNEQLKKYDPITYYKLEGLGNKFNSLRTQYIMPFFNNPKLSNELLSAGTQTLLNEILKDIEENLKIVANQISKKTTKEIKAFIDNYLSKDTKSTLEELDQKYYELTIQIMFKEGNKPSFEEFKELSKTEGFKQMLQINMKMVLDGTLIEALDIIANDPDISTEELLSRIENATANKIKSI